MRIRYIRIYSVRFDLVAGFFGVCGQQSWQQNSRCSGERIPCARACWSHQPGLQRYCRREKPTKKTAKETKKPRNRGRPSKGEQRESAVEKRLDHQCRQSAEQAMHLMFGVIALFADQLLRLIGYISNINFDAALVAVHFATGSF